MPSVSYQHWTTVRAAVLDDIEAARAAIGGSGNVRRAAAQQINRAYAVLLSAEFQGFCKDLHRECADHFTTLVPAAIKDVVEQQFLSHRLLDRGNPNPGNIGADFNRLGLKLFDEAAKADPRVYGWRRSLEDLNDWRNAIAHHEFDPVRLGGTIQLRVARVRGWRAACGNLARVFDNVLGRHLAATTGVTVW